MPKRPRDLTSFEAIALGLFHLAVSIYVVELGFTHVSDDDYSRTVTAALFAHAPRLDPSGTSWLPFPFWVVGSAMMLFGRTPSVATIVSMAVSSGSAALLYIALRKAEVARAPALAAIVASSILPWNAWLGAAPVPEGFTGALMAAACLLAGTGRSPILAALAILAASLSRYEAWPVAAIVAGAVIVVGKGRDNTRRTATLIAFGLAVAGPVFWIAWNAHAHGDPLHFIARVQRFREAGHFAAIPLTDKLFGYPRALLSDAPDLLVAGALGTALGVGDPAFRRRWAVPMVAMLAMVLFLVWGDVHDGAPTHHPIRALTACYWVLPALALDGAFTRIHPYAHGWPKRESFLIGLAMVAALTWLSTLPSRLAEFPGQSVGERRDVQIARGEELRKTHPEGFEVTPCEYEHFALIAAYGAPERVVTQPLTHAKSGPECPRITPLASSPQAP